MTGNKLLLAASLGLLLVACGGQQQADGTAADTNAAAGEIPQTDDSGTVTGAVDSGTAAADTGATETSPPAMTSADAGSMGEGGAMGTDAVDPADPTSGADQPQSDPTLQGTDSTSPQQSASPPPPTQ